MANKKEIKFVDAVVELEVDEDTSLADSRIKIYPVLVTEFPARSKTVNS